MRILLTLDELRLIVFKTSVAYEQATRQMSVQEAEAIRLDMMSKTLVEINPDTVMFTNAFGSKHKKDG